MKIHKTEDGRQQNIYIRLPDSFFAIDARDYQVVQPQLNMFKKKDAKIISLIKIRDHVLFERAIVAVRFSKYSLVNNFIQKPMR